MKPLLIAHRGDTINYPENTLEAFRSAFALGADGVECDIQENDQGDIIIVHNYIFDRTTVYPLFSDFLKEFAAKGRLEIELKTISSAFVEKVAKLIREYKPKDYEITSSILPLLPVVRRFLPDALIGMIFKPYLIEDWMTEEFTTAYIISYIKLTGADMLHLWPEYYTPSLIRQLHANRILTHSHITDNSLAKYNKIVELGIDQCTVDDVTLLEKVRGSGSSNS